MDVFCSTRLSCTQKLKTTQAAEIVQRSLIPLILLLLLLPGTVIGQNADEPLAPTTKGFYLEGMVSAGTMTFSDFAGVDAGGTFSGRLGYGITNSIGLFAGVQAGQFSTNSEFTNTVHSSADAYALGSFDLGAQYNFRAMREWVPYVEIAYTGIITGDDLSNTFSANGVTLGGGVKYHVSDTWALNGRVQLSPVNVYSLDYNGQELDNQKWGGLSTRFSVGLTWFPFR